MKNSLIGHGRTAEVYAWDDGEALKLYYAGWPAAEVEAEARKAQIVYDSGAPAPVVKGVIEIEGRYGVIFERVDGPSLVNKTTAQPWTLIRAARLQAELHAQMHTCRVAGLPAQRTQLAQKIQAARPLSEKMKRAALEALAGLPEGDVLCHGDFHPDNVVLSARGPVILDWTGAAYGHPLADVARTSMMMQMAVLPPDMPRRRLIEFGRALWHSLYLNRYCRLRAVSPQQVQRWRVPIMAARLSEGITEEEPLLLNALENLGLG